MNYHYQRIAAMTDTLSVRHADSAAELTACFAVMRELRPQLRNAEDLLTAIATQREQGYRLLVAWVGDKPVALAGYRQLDNLIHGRFLYVDDLVTSASERGQGQGARLLAELKVLAQARSCQRLVLDTGLANSLAQRFYFRSGFLTQGLHFSMDLQ
jgi:ribosomal protein S18 acetylase RimI-like enzyme